MNAHKLHKSLPAFWRSTHSALVREGYISVKQFKREDLEYVFGVAHEMRGMVERVGTFDLLKGKILANLFYEPSTRPSRSPLRWSGLADRSSPSTK